MGANSEISKAFFIATAAGDKDAIRAICSPDMSAAQNGGPPMDVAALARFAAAVKRVVPDFHYENAVRADTPTGFVEEHDVCGTLPDGTSLHLTVCVVADVKDGKITSLREYLDGASATGLIGALSAGR